MQWCTKVDKYKIWMHNDSISAYKQTNKRFSQLLESEVNAYIQFVKCMYVCPTSADRCSYSPNLNRDISRILGVARGLSPRALSKVNRLGVGLDSPGDACMSAPHPLIGALIMWRHPNSQLHWCSKSVRVYIIMLYFQHCLILIFTLNTIMDQDWCAAFGVILWIEDWDAQLEESDCVQHRKYSDQPMQWRK